MAAKQIRASNVAFQSHKPAFSPPTLKDITVSEWRQQCIIGVQKGIVGLFAFVVGSLKEYCDVHSVPPFFGVAVVTHRAATVSEDHIL